MHSHSIICLLSFRFRFRFLSLNLTLTLTIPLTLTLFSHTHKTQKDKAVKTKRMGAERSVNNISYKTNAVLKPQLKPPWKVFKPLLISTRQTRKYMYLFVLLEFVVFHNQCRKIFSIPVLHKVFCYLKFWFLL